MQVLHLTLPRQSAPSSLVQSPRLDHQAQITRKEELVTNYSWTKAEKERRRKADSEWRWLQ